MKHWFIHVYELNFVLLARIEVEQNWVDVVDDVGFNSRNLA
jgi:hypothetical protein